MKSLSLIVYRAEDSRTYLSRLRALESKGENWQGSSLVQVGISEPGCISYGFQIWLSALQSMHKCRARIHRTGRQLPRLWETNCRPNLPNHPICSRTDGHRLREDVRFRDRLDRFISILWRQSRRVFSRRMFPQPLLLQRWHGTHRLSSYNKCSARGIPFSPRRHITPKKRWLRKALKLCNGGVEMLPDLRCLGRSQRGASWTRFLSELN